MNGAGGRDWRALLLGLATVAVLAYTAWLRFAPRPWADPPAPGTTAPPRILKMRGETAPRLLLDLRGHVAWIVFGPADADNIAALRRFEQSHPLFRLIVATPEGAPETPDTNASFSDATRRSFGARDLPLHVLIDEEGRVLATARGDGREGWERLLAAARERLKQLEPVLPERFA